MTTTTTKKSSIISYHRSAPPRQRNTILFLLIILLGTNSHVSDAANNDRLVTFQYVEDSAVCGDSSDGEWNFRLDEFHIDCGNANHGCTPGHGVMVYGQFEAMDKFSSVADIDIGACVFGSMVCSPNLVEADMNLCSDLELWDLDGYQQCNQVGNYTFEASYLLPNHTWFEDFAFEGFTFNIFITLGQDLTCYAEFVTHVWYGNDTWMAFTVCSSLAFVLGVYYYVIQKKRRQEPLCGKINLVVEEETESGRKEEEGGGGEAEMVTVPPSSTISLKKKQTTSSSRKVLLGKNTNNRSSDFTTNDNDDESVTSTAYLRMLDFSQEGLRHIDRMEMVKRAHFDRLSKTRESRHGPSRGLLLSTD